MFEQMVGFIFMHYQFQHWLFIFERSVFNLQNKLLRGIDVYQTVRRAPPS